MVRHVAYMGDVQNPYSILEILEGDVGIDSKIIIRWILKK
jgi:hypothetical protein